MADAFPSLVSLVGEGIKGIACATLQRNAEKISSSLSNSSALFADKLSANGIISWNTYVEVTENLAEDQRLHKLMQCVIDAVQQDAEVFNSFINILHIIGGVQSRIAQSLEETYSQLGKI